MLLAVYDPAYIKNVLKLNISKIRKEGRLALKPPKDISVSDWADENYILTENSSKPGKWNTKEAPHTKEILNTIKDPRIRQISYMKSSQCAGTECLIIITSYLIDIDPCHIMIMQPSDKEAEDFVNQKLDPAFEEMECLKKKISKKKSREGQNSTLRKKFIGGYLTVVSGRSNSATRQRSARVTIGDDIDGIEKSAAIKEGDPVARLMKRSTTFPDKLNINISTPTRDGESRIKVLYEQSDMRKYYIRCPYCNHEQELIPEQLDWKKDRDMFDKVIRHYEETVRYRCINSNCQALLTETERKTALENGYWKADKPWITHHAGFFISEVSSTLSTMENVAREITAAKVDIVFDERGKGTFDISKADMDKLEALFNTVFGRTYKQTVGKETDPTTLMERVEDFIDPNNIVIPEDTLLLTCSVDLQAGMDKELSRLEVKVVGWGTGEQNWICYLGKIPGDLQKSVVWDKLDEFRERKWVRRDGVEMNIKLMFIDSGYLPQTVYDYVRSRQKYGVYATKGANKYGASLLQRKASMVDKGRVKLIIIGTQAAKQEIFDRLNNITEPGPKYTHFPKCFCGASYFKQLTSEVAVRKTTGLIDYYVYEKKDKHQANEAIDLMVYNYAAMKMYMIFNKWEHLERKYKALAKTDIKPLQITPAADPEKKEEPVKQVKKKKRISIKIN